MSPDQNQDTGGTGSQSPLEHAKRFYNWALDAYVYEFPATRREIESEIEVFEIEMKTLRSLTEDRNGDEIYANNALKLLRLGKKALNEEDFDPVAAKRCLLAAKRWAIMGSDQLNPRINTRDTTESTTAKRCRLAAKRWVIGGSDQLNPRINTRDTTEDGTGGDITEDITYKDVWAKRIWYESREVLSPWRLRAVEDLLETKDQQLKSSIDRDRVFGAATVLHDYLLKSELRSRIMTRQFIYFIVIGYVALLAAFVLISWLEAPLIVVESTALQSPNTAVQASNTTVPPPNTEDPTSNDIQSPIFLALIVCFGVLGATTSGMLSLSQELKRVRHSEYPINIWLAVAQVTIGAVAALVVFTFLLSGLLSIPVGPSGISPQLVLAVSFAAGFSERLLLRTLRKIDQSNPEGRRY